MSRHGSMYGELRNWPVVKLPQRVGSGPRRAGDETRRIPGAQKTMAYMRCSRRRWRCKIKRLPMSREIAGRQRGQWSEQRNADAAVRSSAGWSSRKSQVGAGRVRPSFTRLPPRGSRVVAGDPSGLGDPRGSWAEQEAAVVWVRSGGAWEGVVCARKR